jgi:hypothetical protein
MTSRVFRLLSALYPRAWRARYANELADLCREFVDVREIARWRLALNVVIAASAVRLRSRPHPGHRLLIGGGATAVIVVAILAATTAGFGNFSATPSSKGPLPMVISQVSNDPTVMCSRVRSTL